ncbi:hypothetical protein ACFE04_008203 [Oxalis oulophora]
MGLRLEEVVAMLRLMVMSQSCCKKKKGRFWRKQDPEGINWTLVCVEIKEFYWDEFGKFVIFDEDDEAIIKAAWDSKAPKHYRDYVHRVKSGKNSQAKGTHTGGSISTSVIKQRLTEENNGTPPTLEELFLFIHTKKHDNTTFVHSRSREIRLTETYSQQNNEIDEHRIFLESMREEGRSLSRPYGFGSETRILLGSSSTQRSTSKNINASTFGSSREEASGIRTHITSLENFNARILEEIASLKTALNLDRSSDNGDNGDDEEDEDEDEDDYA